MLKHKSIEAVRWSALELAAASTLTESKRCSETAMLTAQKEIS
jgi:hypothetical protein